jgi:acyl carrier protein
VEVSETDVGPGQIRNVVREYLLTEFLPRENPDELKDSTPLITGGILDSIGTVKLVSHLEQQFDVRFESFDISVDYLDTVDLIVQTVVGKLRG